MRRSRLRVFFYVQHLSGVGHIMRSMTLARHLARSHEVWLTQGGVPVPGADDGSVRPVLLPGIRREDNRVLPVDPGRDLVDIWRERHTRIRGAIEALRPDIVIVEHYPFSKWELADEIDDLLDESVECNPAVRHVCSVRDIPLQTAHETCGPDIYQEKVLDQLNSRFHALLVHGDHRHCGLEASFQAAGRIGIPVCHTGIVCQTGNTDELPPTRREDLHVRTPYVVASIGGGKDTAALLSRLGGHWREIREMAGIAHWNLVMFNGLRQQDPALARIAGSDDSITVHPFSSDYASWLRDAELSISCSGYNTCADLLRTRTPALLVPNTRMSDQVKRAQLLHAGGYAHWIHPERFTPDSVALAMREVLGRTPDYTGINLDGAQNSCRFIEGLGAANDKSMPR